jgi:hypothetical protein
VLPLSLHVAAGVVMVLAGAAVLVTGRGRKRRE